MMMRWSWPTKQAVPRNVDPIRDQLTTCPIQEKIPHVLRAKALHFDAIRQAKSPRPFEEVWNLLREELVRNSNIPNRHRLPSAKEALAILKKPMMKEYSNGMEFDQALFQAMKRCLSPIILMQQQDDDEDSILLHVGSSTREFAVGIARHTLPALEHLMDGMLTGTEWIQLHYERTGMKDQQFTSDHAVCLFHKRKSTWSVTDYLAIMQLKLSDTSCEDFDMTTNDDGSISHQKMPDMGGRHAALGQSVLFNVGYTLLHQAKVGVLQDYIPLSMIAAKKKKKKSPLASQKQKLRWFSGKLQVPEACGGAFFYSVDGFGKFSDDDHDKEEESVVVEQALSLYIETALFGLIPAIDVQKTLASGKRPIAVPASGKFLMIGNTKLDLEFYASPIPGAVTSHDLDQIDMWKTTDGELFRGRLDVDDVLGDF